MKQLIIMLSIFFVASLSIQAQNRSRVRPTEKKEVSKTKKNPSKKVSTKAVKSTRNSNSVHKAANSERSVNRTTRPVRTRTDEQPRNGTANKDRKIPTRNGNYNKGKRPTGINTHKPQVTVNRNRVTRNRKVTTNRKMAVNNHRIVNPPTRRKKVHRHGHKPKTQVHFGFNHHEVIIFPMHITEHFYYNHPVFLINSYVPSIEYPWAIYQSEENANEAYIEGEVIDVTYSRRTGRFMLHFGRPSPFQSATVVFSERLSRQFRLNKRMIRKLRGEYVSISGFFNDYGNVPTIKVMDVDQIYVNEHPFADYIYY